jgi:hypothetical protein
MAVERIFAVSGEWAIGADNLQWILYKKVNNERGWRPVSFVSSSCDILARCMKENGCGLDAEVLLLGLPATFAEWKRNVQVNSVMA